MGTTAFAHAGSGYPPCLSACDNQDPANYWAGGPSFFYHCSDDATTVKSYLETVGSVTKTIQLRYSNRCETVWGRIYNVELGNTLFIQQWDGDTWITKIRWIREYTAISDAYTPMWDDHGVLDRVCFGAGDSVIDSCSAGY